MDLFMTEQLWTFLYFNVDKHVVIVLFVQQFQPKPLEELTVEQPPDDVEIEPDEQTDAFTVSVSLFWLPLHSFLLWELQI